MDSTIEDSLNSKNLHETDNNVPHKKDSLQIDTEDDERKR